MALHTPARAPHLSWRLWLLVGLGGTAGAAAREAGAALLPPAAGVPLGIAVVNLLGAFLLGFLYARLDAPAMSLHRAARLQLLFGTGFCGGFTTYSALAVDAVLLGRDGAMGTALLYVLGTVLLGAGATVLGIVAGTARTRARARP